MPLSSYGLCEAETTAPIAPRRAASNAIAAVGATPMRITSTPSDESPATNAASSIGVEMRLSPPTTAVDAPSTRAAARPRSSAKEAVSSVLARPRTPSVPNCTADSPGSALGELLRLAGLDEAVLLALLLPRVAGEEAGLLQDDPLLGVELSERAGDRHAQRAGLAGHAAAVDRRLDVVRLGNLGNAQRLGDDHPLGGGREVDVERTPVDRDVTGALAQAGAGDGLLAAAGGLRERLGCHESAVPRLGQRIVSG